MLGQIVSKAFQAMEEHWQRYDQDHNRRFNYQELVLFLGEQLPNLYPGCLDHIEVLYPVKQREVRLMSCLSASL